MTKVTVRNNILDALKLIKRPATAKELVNLLGVRGVNYTRKTVHCVLFDLAMVNDGVVFIEPTKQFIHHTVVAAMKMDVKLPSVREVGRNKTCYSPSYKDAPDGYEPEPDILDRVDSSLDGDSLDWEDTEPHPEYVDGDVNAIIIKLVKAELDDGGITSPMERALLEMQLQGFEAAIKAKASVKTSSKVCKDTFNNALNGRIPNNWNKYNETALNAIKSYNRISLEDRIVCKIVGE
jgi:hypothetical protein